MLAFAGEDDESYLVSNHMSKNLSKMNFANGVCLITKIKHYERCPISYAARGIMPQYYRKRESFRKDINR